MIDVIDQAERNDVGDKWKIRSRDYLFRQHTRWASGSPQQIKQRGSLDEQRDERERVKSALRRRSRFRNRRHGTRLRQNPAAGKIDLLTRQLSFQKWQRILAIFV